MYRLFYNHSALKGVLVIVINPEAQVASSKEKGNVVAVYDKDKNLIGINIFHIDDVMKIKANGVIFVPSEKLLEIINNILTKEGFDPLPPVLDSGYRVAKVSKKNLQSITLRCAEEEYETQSDLKGIKEGSVVVIAVDGTILHNGSLFHKKPKNEARIMSAPELHIEGKEDEAFLLNEEPTFIPGEDFFIR